MNLTGRMQHHSRETIIFFSTILAALIYNWITYQAFYIPSPDGDLYISVATNFIHNGHFIQTARPYEVNFVVPPGLPLLLTLVLGLTYSTGTVIVLQYVLFGLTSVLLTRVSESIYSTRYNCFLIPILFLSGAFYVNAPNPGYVLTETYTIFLVSLSAFLFLNPTLPEAKKITLLLPTLFCAYLIRPVVAGALVVALVAAIYLVIRRRYPLKRLASLLLLFTAFMGGNLLVNHRETGYWIMLEDYGAIPAYQANNSNTKTYEYDSSLAEDFSDDYFMQVYFDNSLDTYQKNQLLKEKTGEFVKANPSLVLKNTVEKYENLFFHNWNWNGSLLFLSFLLLTWKKHLRLIQTGLLLITFALLTIPPSMGLYIFRYSVICLPFYIVLNGTLYLALGSALERWLKGGALQ